MESAKKKSGIRLPARAAAWYVASSIIARGVGVLGTPVFTRLLDPAEYGLFPLYNGYLSILTVLCSLELTGSVLYKELGRHEGKKEEVLCSALAPCLLTTLLFGTIYLPFHGTINRLSGLSTSVSIILISQTFINIVSSIYASGMRYEYKYKTVAMLNLFAALGAPIVSVALIRLTPLRSEARIVGLVIATALIAVALLPAFIRGRRGFVDIPTIKGLVKTGLPLLPYYLSFTLINRINELTVGRFLGTGALGGYSIAVALGSSLNILSLGILSALNPWIARRLKDKDTNSVRELVTLCFYALCLAAILLLGIMPEVIKIVTPPDFHYALGYVYPICLSVIPAFLSGALSSAAAYLGRGGRVSVYAVAVALISTVSSFITVPLFGEMAGAIITLGSYILLTLTNCVVYKRAAGELPLKLFKCSAAFLISAIFCMLLFTFREVLISRALLLLATLPLCFLLAKRVIINVKES